MRTTRSLKKMSMVSLIICMAIFIAIEIHKWLTAQIKRHREIIDITASAILMTVSCLVWVGILIIFLAIR